MWIKIARLILRNRIWFSSFIIVVTAFLGYHATFVELEYEYATLLPETDSAYIEYKKFKNLFGEDANVLVFGVQDSNFFELEKFNDWIKLGDSVKNIEGVQQVISIARVFNLQKDKEEKRFRLRKLFPDTLQTQAQMDSMAAVVRSLPFYKGLMYNDSSHVYLMALTIAKEKVNSEDRIELVDNIERLARQFADKHNIELHLSGLPYTRTRIAEMIKKELNMFIILAAIVTALIMYLFFRSFKVMTFAMLIVGLGVVWSLGSLHLFGYKITILTGLIPPLLIVIGIPNSIFLLNKYYSEYAHHKNKIKALQRMIHKVGNATFLTNLTTASGFATFIITNNRILTEFGIVASINIMGVFILSILLIPIFFSYLSDPKEKHFAHLENGIIKRIVKLFCLITVQHRKSVYIAIATFLVLAVGGVYLIKTSGYIVDDIPKDDPVYIDLKFFETHVKGVMPMEILIDTRKKKGMMKLSVLQKIDRLQNILHEKYAELSPPISLAEGIKFARQAYYNGKEKHYRLPSEMEKNFILSYLAKDKGKGDLLNTYIDSTQRFTRISLKVADIGSERMYALVDSVKADIQKVFPKAKYDTILTGSSIIYTYGTSHLIKNLFTSLILAIILISIFMAIMFRSFRMIAVSVVPNLLPLLFTAAIMGYFNIPIKPSTVLVFSIAFGISVDSAIHFLAKYRQELKANDWDIGVSVIKALRETGISILYTAVVLFFGFGIFTASDFGGTIALGILVALTLLIAMFCNLLLLPSLLLTLEKSITTKAFREPLLRIYDEEEDIELDDLIIDKKD